MDFKALVLAVVTVVWLYQLLISFIRMRSAKNPTPANVADVYDEETYKKWRAYHAEKTRFSIVTATAAYVIELVLLVFDLYAKFAGLFPKWDFAQLFAVILLSSLTELLLIPLSWYETMNIEERYGFNKTKAGTFWADQVKDFVIGLMLTTGIAAALWLLHQWLGGWLILAFAGVMMAFMMAVMFLFPVLSKIFNKFKPLEDGELKDKLTGLLEKNGYHVRGIKVMDASRRTTKSNAYFTGIGKMKTIVLYDTLVEAMTTNEICAVFSHELGHGLHKDTLKLQGLSFVQMFVLGAMAWLTLQTPEIFRAFGFEEIGGSFVNYGFALLLVMNVEFALIAPLFGLVSNALSRKFEYRADAQAVKEGYGKELITALKTLAKQNYAELAPSPMVVKLAYDHPPLSERIAAIEKSEG